MKIGLKIYLPKLALVLCLCSIQSIYAQNDRTKNKSTTIRTTREKEKESAERKPARIKSDYIKKKNNSYWIFGIGGNVVDDDGNPFRKLFNAVPRWNVMPYPTRITAEKYIGRTFSIEGAFNFNRYKPGKIINNDQTHGPGIFLSADLNFKNDINKMANLPGRFNPYVVYGLGATYRTVRALPIGGNMNVGLGANFWITHLVGINVQSIAKFGVSRRFPESSSNYLQHSASVVFKLQKGGKNPFIKRRYKWIRKNDLNRERSSSW